MKAINLPFSFTANPVRLVLYATLFSMLLFIILPLSQMFNEVVDEKVIVRNIEIVAQPPAPPPSTELAEDSFETESINIPTAETEIAIEPLDITLEAGLVGELDVKIDAGNFKVKGSYGKSDLLADIQTFRLEELDSIPRNINEPLFRVPPELAEQGISKFTADIQVILNEEGEVEFKSFNSISHEGAAKAIREYVEKLRFTPPQKDGKVGRVEFRLPFTSGSN